MRFDRFDLNLLVALDALLEERNVTRAAERLHIGQSAASGALARLRDYFNDELLTPVGRELRLTPTARSLVQPVRETLLRARATLSLRPDFDPATAEREFGICASDYACTVLLADVLREAAARAPGIQLHLQSLPRDLFDVFERGGIDFLILPDRYSVRIEHPRAHLFDDSHVVIAWSGNPLLGDALSFEQYLELGHVSLRIGLPGTNAFEEWLFPDYRHLRRIEASIDSFTLLPRLIVGTQRIAVIQHRLALLAAQELPLRILPVPRQTPPLVETMCWPRYLDVDPAHAWIRNLIQERAALLGEAPGTRS